ncbi:FAD-dependent oxidoreductase [Nonomuraea phyllanthi]|uniref:FAD-dependent oxidoreductase n=1 Tax=Nonomuraea phyllanthi TaxID=2219224 RepID=A0A5C4VZT8_9ACTN|nr:FAD-dependent oxidoreductase [Nonomuraea phyllanthi]KAB8190955.1 FAD-dependent oxidoreductase [Nonomuraea phyllanthi]
MKELDVEVLVVGGGPVGLCTAIELSRHGISTLLVERHAGTSIFPKARLITTRTMELFRAWGIQEEVERAGMPREEYLAVGVGSSLTATDFVRAAAELSRDAPQSPTYTFLCAQDLLEVILRRLAESLTDVRFATSMTGTRPTGDGVEAVISGAGGETLVRCRYLVAADGGRSGVRESLGITTEGPPPLGHMISIMFEADLGFLPPERRAALSFLREPPCAVEAVDQRRRWMVQTGYDPEEGGSPEDFTDEVCLRAVRDAVGVPDLPVTLLGMLPWVQQVMVASAFRSGPVFLAGDAAHVATPQGGFGMNCGIQDAHNLAWKLAAVLRGRGGEGLLDTYEAERRPIAARTVDESLSNALITFQMMEGRLSMDEAIQRQADRRSSEGLVLGFHYASAAVVPDGTPPPAPEDPYRTYVPTARPGHRAPHVWLTGRDGQVSTLDLLGPRFTLMAPAGAGWLRAAREAAAATGVPLTAVEIADGDTASPLTSPTWAKEYGLGPRGAVLVRPDGHVGWRAHDTAPSASALVDALTTILSRP